MQSVMGYCMSLNKDVQVFGDCHLLESDRCVIIAEEWEAPDQEGDNIRDLNPQESTGLVCLSSHRTTRGLKVRPGDDMAHTYVRYLR